MTDPVRGLEHDHVPLSETVARIRARLVKSPAREVIGDLPTLRLVEGLRDDLLAHFAKEEEGLFPFLSREVPDLARDVDRLLAGHESVCGCIVRLAHSLSVGRGAYEDIVALFERFERVYAEHSRSEVSLLRTVGTRLDETQRRELASLLDGL
jgi:iron-sulfur cluster repair protein YtfE (RIC family)